MQFIKELFKDNWQDILFFIVAALGLSVMVDLVVGASVRWENVPGLALFASMLTGFSRFAAANLCAWLLGVAVQWGIVNRWQLKGFDSAWNNLGDSQKLWVVIVLFGIEAVVAGICFAA